MSKRRFQRIVPKIKTLDPDSIHSFLQHFAREQDFLETLFNAIREGVIVLDSGRRVLYHNAAAKTLLGIPDDFSRLTIDKLLRGVNWDSILRESDSARILRQELEIFYPRRRILQLYALPSADGDSRCTVILNDVTATLDKAHSEAETERGRLISMLAAGVAHEIGNPLNSLYLHLQFLRRLFDSEDFDRKSAEEELSEAKKEVERLDSIINQFLHALRPGKPRFQRLDLKGVVLESLNFMRHEITAREVKVEFTWGDAVPFISGDASQLKQAFYNLVRNALQSMPHGGSLRIRCDSNEDFVTLSVSDSGTGIASKTLPRIFESYFTTKDTGSGLGLMIVERIVREHGASLSVDSEPGAGATFTISFPRHERRVKILPAPESADAPRLSGPDPHKEIPS